jgi:hypothetical protein
MCLVRQRGLLMAADQGVGSAAFADVGADDDGFSDPISSSIS